MEIGILFYTISFLYSYKLLSKIEVWNPTAHTLYTRVDTGRQQAKSFRTLHVRFLFLFNGDTFHVIFPLASYKDSEFPLSTFSFSLKLFSSTHKLSKVLFMFCV